MRSPPAVCRASAGNSSLARPCLRWTSSRLAQTVQTRPPSRLQRREQLSSRADLPKHYSVLPWQRRWRRHDTLCTGPKATHGLLASYLLFCMISCFSKAFLSLLSIGMIIPSSAGITVPSTISQPTQPAIARPSFCGVASHYGRGDGYHGRRAADGSRFNAYGLSTASRRLPFGTILHVTNASNGKTVVVKVTDRGPFAGRRVLDLSYGAFAAIASPRQGIVKVCATIV